MRPSPVSALSNRYILPLLALGVLCLISILHERWSWSDWIQPQDIYGDPLEIFARVQLAAEQPLQPFVGFTQLARLGAPFQANWGAYPAPDSVVFFLTGQLSHVVGVFGAVKLVAALFCVLNAFSFYLCARHLRWRAEWAVVGALLFAFSNYNIRWGITLSFNQTFTLPPLILLCSHAAKAAPLVGSPRRWLWLGGLLGAWLGLGNPYLGFFAGFLGAATLTLGLLRRCPWERLKPLVCFLAAITSVFLVANLGYAIHYFGASEGMPLIRNYAGSLIYALKPIDWLIPPTEHRIDWAARIGQGYFDQSKVMGEFFPGYLGLAGILGLVGIAVLSLRRLAARPARPLPDAALGLMLVILFATAGSINSMLALGGLDIFRASQRISILANIWVLFFFFGWLQRRLGGVSRAITLALAIAVGAFCWWEQTPHFRSDKHRDALNPKWEGLQQVTSLLESAVGPGARVFQLPVRQFPEAGPLHRMVDYEHFQPFLARSSLHFSYGPMAHSRELAWQQFITRLPATEMIAELEQSGFAAVWINTRAYGDEGARLLREFARHERLEISHDTGAPVRLIRLKPTPTPTSPHLDDLRMNRAWSDPAPSSRDPALLAINGWYPLEQDGTGRWRWAAKRAEVGIWWPNGAPRATLRFKAAVLRDTVLELRQNGQTLLALPLARGEVRQVEQPLNLTSGSNRLVWMIRGEPSYPPRGDTRLLGFRVFDLGIAPADGARK